MVRGRGGELGESSLRESEVKSFSQKCERSGWSPHEHVDVKSSGTFPSQTCLTLKRVRVIELSKSSFTL